MPTERGAGRVEAARAVRVPAFSWAYAITDAATLAAYSIADSKSESNRHARAVAYAYPVAQPGQPAAAGQHR
jgi:hypothetical protein